MRHPLPSLRLAAALVAASALLLAAGALAGGTDSAFSGATANPGNSFHAQASWGCSNPHTDTHNVNVDSWLDENSSGSNFGNDQILKLRSQSGGNDMRVILRAPVPNSPPGCAITDARLRLWTASATNGRTLLATRVAATWGEGSVNWSNQPATTGASASTTSGTGWREWNVTSQINAGGGQHGWVIQDQSENGSGQEQQFHSRENATNRPGLVITFG
jgi:large repetitive protein